MKTANSSAREIQERYNELYANGALSLSKNYSDKFPLLEHLLKSEVGGAVVLDFGCGPGRLSLMLARYALEVYGVDYSGEGIELASVLARAARIENVTFEEGALAWVSARGRRYDVIVLAGVLEHLEQPIDQLDALSRLLKPDGLLCIQSPSFANFRGDIYNTLDRLLELPMSLTDLWQVTPQAMEAAVPKIGLRLEKVVGGHYRLAFLDRVLEDFRHRVPAAARDAGQGAAWKWEKFFSWLAERVEQNRLMIDAWVSQGALKQVPPSPPFRIVRPKDVSDEMWVGLEEYLTYTGWREPWYSDVVPVCYQGASAIYFFRKESS